MKMKWDGRKLRMSFEGEPELVFDMDRVHSAQHLNAEQSGWSKRFADNAAIPAKDPKTGASRVVTEKMRRAENVRLVEHYHGGSPDWSMKASAAPVENPAIRMLADALKISYEAAQAKIADMALEALTAPGKSEGDSGEPETADETSTD